MSRYQKLANGDFCSTPCPHAGTSRRPSGVLVCLGCAATLVSGARAWQPQTIVYGAAGQHTPYPATPPDHPWQCQHCPYVWAAASRCDHTGRAIGNPVKQVRFARENTGRLRMLSREEETRLLAHCGPQLTPLVLAALHTGFRASELTSLTWGDVDFRRRLMTVQAAYAKNGESRSVPMNQQLLHVMRALKDSASEESGQVFLSSMRTPYRSFRTAFGHAVEKTRIDDFTFHDLRHTFASRLVMAGVDLPTVKELMGHKTIAMTLKYTHLQTDHKENAVRRLETFSERNPASFHNREYRRESGESVSY